MPPQCSRDLFGYEVVEGREVVAAFDGGEGTTEAGGLLLGATDRAIGLVGRFAACFGDGRARRLAPRGDLGGRPGAPTRSSTPLKRWWRSGCSASRLGEPALGPAKPDPGEDLIDHDHLRHDPVLAVLAGKLDAKRQNCAPRAGKSTLNRLEHAPLRASRYPKIGHDPVAIEGLCVDLFLAAYQTPPKEIVLDLDATDDPLHGHQEGRFFHGYGACPPAAPGPSGGTATAICRCTCSVAGICWRPSCGGRTSTRPPAPRMK